MTEVLTCLAIPPSSNPENADTELVLVDISTDQITLTLDAGERLVFNRDELLSVLWGERRNAA